MDHVQILPEASGPATRWDMHCKDRLRTDCTAVAGPLLAGGTSGLGARTTARPVVRDGGCSFACTADAADDVGVAEVVVLAAYRSGDDSLAAVEIVAPRLHTLGIETAAGTAIATAVAAAARCFRRAHMFCLCGYAVLVLMLPFATGLAGP